MPPAATQERSVSCRYGRDLTAARRARGAVRDALPLWGFAAYTDAAEAVVSELVANAVTHGAGPVSLHIAVDGDRLLMEVHDDGPARPCRRKPRTVEESGRGLAVIDALIAEEGGDFLVLDDAEGNGKTVCVWLGRPGWMLRPGSPTARRATPAAETASG